MTLKQFSSTLWARSIRKNNPIKNKYLVTSPEKDTDLESKYASTLTFHNDLSIPSTEYTLRRVFVNLLKLNEYGQYYIIEGGTHKDRWDLSSSRRIHCPGIDFSECELFFLNTPCKTATEIGRTSKGFEKLAPDHLNKRTVRLTSNQREDHYEKYLCKVYPISASPKPFV